MVTHICNPSAWEVEVEGSEWEASLGTVGNPVTNKQAYTFAHCSFGFLLQGVACFCLLVV